MNIQISNDINKSYNKIESKVNYLSNKALAKYEKLKGWELEVHVKKSDKADENFECSILTKRPHAKPLFIKKIGGGLDETIRNSFKALSRVVRKESAQRSFDHKELKSLKEELTLAS